MVAEPALRDSVNDGHTLRTRIVSIAADLIAAEGLEAATTRAVALASGVQAPTIYRLFGDKRGLLDAVAEARFAAYVADKASREPHPDPVQDLRDGWDLHVAFGLSHPGLFAIMADDTGPLGRSAAAVAGVAVLLRRVRRIALAGRLKVDEERAVGTLEAACLGTVLTQLRQVEADRDQGLSDQVRDAVLAAITGEAPPATATGPNVAAITLRAGLDQTSVLTAGETALLRELLDRIVQAHQL